MCTKYIQEKWLDLHECPSLKLRELMNLEYFISNTNQWYAQENYFDPRKNFLLESSVCRHAIYSRTRLQWVQLIQNLKSEPGGMKFQMKNSHGFINGYIDVGDGCSRPFLLMTSLRYGWQVMSPTSRLKIQYNIPRARHQHHTLGFCDVGDWLECHQHVENITNI